MLRKFALAGLSAISLALGVGLASLGDAATIGQTVAIGPTNRPDLGITPVVSTAAESSHILCSGSCNLYTLTVVIGVTSGWVILYDALAAPVDGAAAPFWAFPVKSDGTNGGAAALWGSGQMPRPTTGLVAVFSTTGPGTKTASATAWFFAGVQQ